MLSRLLICVTALFFQVTPVHAGPIVVLDPGHGGTNLGAFGPEIQLFEKRLTLLVARRIGSYLAQWLPEAQLLLTRSRDEYVTLGSRVKQANAARATCFVSIHLNASPSRSKRGFEIYLLSRTEKNTSRPSSKTAAPPSAGEGGGSPVQAILADLQLNAAHTESASLAQSVVKTLSAVRSPAQRRSVRQAPFDVLMGLDMPGILVEVGYIDHPLEGRELNTLSAQEQIAAAIAAGIVQFIRGQHRPEVSAIHAPP
jgi:N-acetylmuramoyl-L-alanine amidase